MNAIFTAVVVAAVGWATGKLLDWLWESMVARWRNRGTPLTDAQIHRFHRRRLFVAVGQMVCCVLAAAWASIAYLAIPAPPPLAVAAMIGLLALAAYMWRVVRRRRRRLLEYERSVAHRLI